MPKFIYLNGDLVPPEDAKVSVYDHGLLYGDGVFEGIRAYNGRVFRLDQHLHRLYDSAHVIGLCIPLTVEEMTEAVVATVRANELRDCYIRLVVTRGVGDLGLDPRKCGRPTIIIIADAISLYPEEFYESGLQVITCATRRNSPEALDPSVKSLNYLNNICAKLETIRAGVPEGIMLSSDGYVSECTGDNLFVVQHGEILTPPASLGNLAGITARVVTEIIRELGLPLRVEPFRILTVYTADEAFLTGTAAEVVPLVEADGRKIGDGQPGEITQRILARFREITQSEGTPVYE
ncbi:MAG TPA: branched-chain-amino-acid transaminase [Armatimonadota bacterium]|jgi:branched-chain amino acid aminotransferase